MGASGIARTFAYGGSKGRKIYDPEIKPLVNMSKEEYRQNQNSTSINHFYEKLLLLKDMMNTETAKRMAEHRQAVMEAYLEEFMTERGMHRLCREKNYWRYIKLTVENMSQ